MGISANPFFLDGSQGKLFCIHFAPSTHSVRGHVLYIPPFGEEMNRCRALAAAQARRLAGLDYSCLIMDPFGTGDSEGDLIDASWWTWQTDSKHAIDWLKAFSDAPIAVLGLRLGALLALDIANTHPGLLAQAILWQPVTNGENYLTQLFRQRVAYLVDNQLPPETTQEIRQQILSGNNIEISGYIFSGPLTASIDEKKLAAFSNISDMKINWLEHVSAPDKPVTIGSQKAIERLKQQNNDVDIQTFTSPPLWQLHKRDEATQLLNLTTDIFA